MNPKISIVVPAYNLANYIELTLDSIIRQTYKNIEVIVVDDGSTDRTYDVCRNYANCNSNYDIQVIRKENGGVSSARNAGIAAANGEYICFVDGDDLISVNMVKKLYEIMGVSGLSSCGITHYGKKNFVSTRHLIVDSKNVLIELCDNRLITYSACAKLYRTEICKKILFDCNTGILEDFLFVCEYISRIDNVSITGEIMYDYVKRVGSALNKPFSHKRLELIYSYKKAISIIKKYPDVVPYYNCSFLAELIELDLKMPNTEEFLSDRKKVQSEINNLRKMKIRGSKTKKLKIRLYKISPLLYKNVMKLYRILKLR